MSDLADISDAPTELWRADAERKARAKSAPEMDYRFDGWHCVEEDCQEMLPKERIAMGKVRCVDCQALKELGKL